MAASCPRVSALCCAIQKPVLDAHLSEVFAEPSAVLVFGRSHRRTHRVRRTGSASLYPGQIHELSPNAPRELIISSPEHLRSIEACRKGLDAARSASAPRRLNWRRLDQLAWMSATSGTPARAAAETNPLPRRVQSWSAAPVHTSFSTSRPSAAFARLLGRFSRTRPPRARAAPRSSACLAWRSGRLVSTAQLRVQSSRSALPRVRL